MKSEYNIPDLQTKKRLVDVWDEMESMQKFYRENREFECCVGFGSAVILLESKFNFLANEEDREAVKNG